MTTLSTRIAIIGSNSFSGAWFINHALSKGFEVMGFSRSPEAHPVFLPYKSNTNKAFRFVQANLNTDQAAITDIIRREKITHIVNFAAQGMVAESWQNPLQWFATNTIGNIGLHEQLRKLDCIAKYVHVSTPEVYGTCQGTVAEDTPYNPSTPYAVSKAACDMSLKAFFRNYGFPVAFTRAANVYGPSQLLHRIIPKTILSIATRRKLPLHGGGHSVRSFIHIRDVAAGTMNVMIDAKPGEVFHFSTARFISIRDLVSMICVMMGVAFEDSVSIVDDRPGKDSAYLLDSAKAHTILGWKDTITLEQGLDETIRWVRDNLEFLKNQPDYYIHKA
jgi:dTDP-glucose 4,6-dehydratase